MAEFEKNRIIFSTLESTTVTGDICEECLSEFAQPQTGRTRYVYVCSYHSNSTPQNGTLDAPIGFPHEHRLGLTQLIKTEEQAFLRRHPFQVVGLRSALFSGHGELLLAVAFHKFCEGGTAVLDCDEDFFARLIHGQEQAAKENQPKKP